MLTRQYSAIAMMVALALWCVSAHGSLGNRFFASVRIFRDVFVKAR